MSNNFQNGVIAATEGRRVGFMRDEEEWFIHKFHWSGFRSPVILPWIRDHTEGRFYLSSSSVGFDKEKDYLMFKLGYKYFD